MLFYNNTIERTKKDWGLNIIDYRGTNIESTTSHDVRTNSKKQCPYWHKMGA